MDQLKTAIERIGRQMVSCRLGCKGIACKQDEGILPRCLVLETSGRHSAAGCVVVGINPGRAKRREQNFYRERGASYSSVLAYWKDTIHKLKYYSRVRQIVEQLNLDGAILWTELAKCENEKGRPGLPPLSTMRQCTAKFLSEELKFVPPEWPLFGLGTEAYKALAYLYPQRTVVGIPHPTGSFGHFDKLKKALHANSETRDLVSRLLAQQGGSLWLGDGSKKVLARGA